MARLASHRSLAPAACCPTAAATSGPSASSIVFGRRRRRPSRRGSRGRARPRRRRSRRTRSSPKFVNCTRSTTPCLYSSSTARNRTISSSRLVAAGHEGAEAHRLGVGQQSQHDLDRVAHARADRCDVLGVDHGGRDRAEDAQRRGPQRGGLSRSSGSGTSERNGSSGPAARGTLRSARRMRASSAAAASLNVLHSSRRASSRSRSSNRSSSSSSSTSSRPGSSRRAFSSTSVAAMRRNSVATSRSSVSQALELGEVRVDDRRERHLPELDLLLEDEVQQEVERTLEDGRADLVAHRTTTLPARVAVDATLRITCASGWANHAMGRRRRPIVSRPVPRVFSGIQPTGEMHLGNYLGAVRHWVRRPARPTPDSRSTASSTSTR